MQQQTPLRVALAGLGTVGVSTMRILQDKAGLLAARTGRTVSVVAVSARSKGKDRGIDLTQAVWFDDPVEMARTADIDVFIELIGGDEGPAKLAVEAALDRGVHVVTANKALLAKHGKTLAAKASVAGVNLNYEAAVAGGIPVIKTLRESLSGNRVNKIYGILNGTCNYILTQMEQKGLAFADVLKTAQELGYAEADPTFDIEGHDTGHKLAILASLCFGTEISFDDVYLEGISNISPKDLKAARELGYAIKLVGAAQRTESGIEQRVHPAMVPADSPLGSTNGVLNAVMIEADAVGELFLSGPGAGGNATASAVVGDIADIALGSLVPVFGLEAGQMTPYTRAKMRAHEGGYYIRLSLQDKPGSFAAIANLMAEKNISLESIVQKGLRQRDSGADGLTATIIIITHATTEQSVRDAMEAMKSAKLIVDEPQVIRIEKF